MKRLAALTFLLCFPLAGHIGNKDIFFEGLAGPYPLYVTVRPPVVIPGVAEISIRASTKDIQRIRMTPMPLTGAGSKFPPTPDLAVRSKDDPQTFTGGLWIMYANAWQVQLMVDGARGPAGLSIPVPAVSTKVTEMDQGLGIPLMVLLLILVSGVVGIAGAALRESQLPPGQSPGTNQRRNGRVAMAAGLLLGIATVYLGQQWWAAEAANYARTIYKPLDLQASLNGDRLTLQMGHTGWNQNKKLDDFIPDHGHLMHLYAVRSPNLDQVFHLHPSFEGSGRFTMNLPGLPAGEYRLFGDIVHRNGFPETVTTSLQVPDRPNAPPFGPDDAGAAFPAEFSAQRERILPDGGKVILEIKEPLRPGRGESLRFRILDKDGNPARDLQPYLGMSAHLGVFRQDLKVFSHVHPAGNISMAAFDLAQQNLLTLPAAAAPALHSAEGGLAPVDPDFSFPYGFPEAGPYRLVLQFRRLRTIVTLNFEIIIKN